MTTKVVHNEQDERFEADVEGGLAFAEYTRDGNTIRFTHTEVPQESEGKGVAGAIVKEALEYAKREKLDVEPSCRYVKGYIDRNPEYQSLVKAS